MADVTEELAELNATAKELLEKYDGAFNDMVDELKKVTESGLTQIQELSSEFGKGIFAGFWGPHSWNDIYINNWHKAINFFPEHFEIQGDVEDQYTGIKILKDGIYRCEGYQRGVQDNRYFCVAMNGERSPLENTDSGIWGHDHSNDNGDWSLSKYVGKLSAGDIITGGYHDADSGKFEDYGYAGGLIITRIGDINE